MYFESIVRVMSVFCPYTIEIRSSVFPRGSTQGHTVGAIVDRGTVALRGASLVARHETRLTIRWKCSHLLIIYVRMWAKIQVILEVVEQPSLYPR